MKKQFIKRIFSALLSLIIVVAVIGIVYATVSVDSKPVFGFHLFCVTTGSMSGTIEQGELIVTKSIGKNHLKVKDIITFTSIDPAISGKFNTHRIIKIQKGLFFTKGDANPTVDPYPVAYKDIAGKVIFHSHLFGKLIRLLSNPFYMLIFLIVPIVLISVSDILNGFRKSKEAVMKEFTDHGKTEKHPKPPAKSSIDRDHPPFDPRNLPDYPSKDHRM